MTTSPDKVTAPFTIMHATSLLAQDAPAFEHSVALALKTRAKLYTVNARDARCEIFNLPDAEQLVARWGDERVEHYAFKHECCDNTVDTLLDAVQTLSPDVIVVGKQERDSALERLFHESISEALSRNTLVPTLVVPSPGRGFVAPRTGEVTIERVLLPTLDEATMLAALDRVRALLQRAGIHASDITLLHVGEGSAEELALMLPEDVPSDEVTVMVRPGTPHEVILEVADAIDADLIAMATHGHDSLLDVTRGSRTELVMRRAKRPVMVVPLT